MWNFDRWGAPWQREKKASLRFRYVFRSIVSFDPCLCPFQFCVRVPIYFLHCEGCSVTVYQQSDACCLLGKESTRQTFSQQQVSFSVLYTEGFDGFPFWVGLYSVCLPRWNVSRHVLLFGSGGSSHTVHACTQRVAWLRQSQARHRRGT